MNDGDPAPRRPMTGTERLLSGAFLFCFGGLLLAEVLGGAGVARLSIAFVALAWAPMIVLHELGHLITARMLGFGVCELVIGHGPPVLRGRIGETHWTLRAVPVGGHVIPFSRTGRQERLKSALIYFGGPLAELLVIGALFAAVGFKVMLNASDSVPVIAAQSLALAAAMGVVFNLFPLAYGDAVTDGLGMLLSLTLPPDTFAQSAAEPYLDHARRALAEDRARDALQTAQRGCTAHPDNGRLQALRAVCLAAAGQSDAAYSQLEDLRRLTDLSVAAEAAALDAAAQVVLETDDFGRANDALKAARNACAQSNRLEYRLTLARVEAMLGKHAQATATLLAAYSRASSPQLEAECLAELTAAHRALGLPEQAARFRRSLQAYRPGARLVRLAAD